MSLRLRHAALLYAQRPTRVVRARRDRQALAGVPTSHQSPRCSSPRRRARAMARFNSGSSGNLPGEQPAKNSGRYMPTPGIGEAARVSRSTTKSPSRPKSPRGMCAGLGTSTMHASARSIEREMPKSISVQTSPLTTRNGSGPSSGSALKIPPPGLQRHRPLFAVADTHAVARDRPRARS